MENGLAQLMEENLYQVWNERDDLVRIKAIEKIYATNSNLYHIDDTTSGLNEINNSISNTLKNMPPDFVFTKLNPVIINNSIGRMVWGAGPKDQNPVITAMDIAHFENGKIKSLYVFLDK